MTQVLLIRNTSAVQKYLTDSGYRKFNTWANSSNTGKYVRITGRYFMYKTSHAEKQYHPDNRIIGDLNTLQQLELLKSLGLKDQEIWNQLKELT